MTEPFTMPLQHSTAEKSITWIPSDRDMSAAIANHDQTLETLARRAGVSWCELAAIVEGRDWRKMEDGDARAAVWTELKRRALQPDQ